MYHEVDVYIGRRVRERRMALGMSQVTLAEKLGVSYQQIQKYETGANRISGSRLWEISVILKVPVAYFFEGLTREGVPEESSTDKSGKKLGRGALELARAVNAIENEEIKTEMLRLAKAFAKAG